MAKKISLLNSEIYYEEMPLFYGRKKIDLDVCKKNLLDLGFLAKKKNVDFGIIFGTLLGAIREKNFIKHDEDVDVYVLDEHKECFLELLPELINLGFMIARYDGRLLSIIRNGDYIDVYFFKRSFLGNRVCGNLSINRRFFDGFDVVCFLGEEFNAPVNHLFFLESMYGKDWMTPKESAHANPMSIFSMVIIYIKKVIKLILPKPALALLKKFNSKIWPKGIT